MLLEEVTLFNKQISIYGIHFYVHDQTTFLISSIRPLKVLGSAVLGGNLRWARYIINHSVDRSYHESDPEQDLKQVTERLQLGHDVLGLMTAVSVTHTVLSYGSHKELSVATLCTAGIGNPGVAGLPLNKISNKNRLGTINLIMLIDGNLTDSAMVNAIITATEAKTRALFNAKISLSSGERITGTTTDAIVVACTGKGEPLRYAGTATELGYLIGRTVYKAVTQGVNTYLLLSRGEYEFRNKQNLMN